MSITPFLLFAVLVSIGVYFVALNFLQTHRITQRRYILVSVLAFLVFGVLCGWIGYELARVRSR